jgi:hypothetical protein
MSSYWLAGALRAWGGSLLALVLSACNKDGGAGEGEAEAAFNRGGQTVRYVCDSDPIRYSRDWDIAYRITYNVSYASRVSGSLTAMELTVQGMPAQDVDTGGRVIRRHTGSLRSWGTHAMARSQTSGSISNFNSADRRIAVRIDRAAFRSGDHGATVTHVNQEGYLFKPALFECTRR